MLAIACAGAGDPGGIQVRFLSPAALQNSNRIDIYLYEAANPCTQLRQTLPRPKATLGPFEVTLDATQQAEGVTYSSNDIPVGTYVVFVDAYAPNGAIVASGCAEGQRVFDRQLSKIEITVTAGP